MPFNIYALLFIACFSLRQDIHNRLGEISVYSGTISEVIGEISKKIKINVFSDFDIFAVKNKLLK